MALTISQIIQIAWPAIAYDHRGRRQSRYVLGPVMAISGEPAYYTLLRDPETGTVVPITWTHNDEIAADTEVKKVALVKTMLINAMDSMDFLIEDGYRQPDFNKLDGPFDPTEDLPDTEE